MVKLKNSAVSNLSRLLFSVAIAITVALMVFACGKGDSKSDAVEIPPGLALGNLTAAYGQTIEVPMTLKTDELIMGLQFDLVWDTSLVKIGEPVMVLDNQHMSIKTRMNEGRLRTLIFSVQSKPMNLVTNEVLKIPVTVRSRLVGQTPLQLTQVIVAGSDAHQLQVPVQSGVIKLSGTAAN